MAPRSARATAILAVPLLALAGCLPGGLGPTDPDPPTPPSTSPEVGPLYEGAELPDLEVTEMEVPAGVALEDVSHAWRVGDLVILYQEGGGSVAIDTADGTMAWTSAGEPMPLITAEDGLEHEVYLENGIWVEPSQEVLAVPTFAGDGQSAPQGHGLVGYKVRFPGTDLWSVTLQEPAEVGSAEEEQQRADRVTVRGSNDEAMVGVIGGSEVSRPDDVSVEPFEEEEFSMFAVDPSDGALLWEAEQVFPDVLEGDHLLVLSDPQIDGGVLQSRDPVTGEVRWELEGTSGRWVDAAGDLGYAVVTEGEEQYGILVDLASGEILDEEIQETQDGELAPAPAIGVHLGEQDGEAFAAWTSLSRGFPAEDLGWAVHSQDASSTESVRGAEPLVTTSMAEHADGGYVWIQTTPVDDSAPSIAAIDRTGALRTEAIPARDPEVFDGVIAEPAPDGGDGGLRLWTYELPGS